MGLKMDKPLLKRMDKMENSNRMGTISWGPASNKIIRQNIHYYSPNPPLSTNSCPDNLDFEFGNFTNWNCYVGSGVDSNKVQPMLSPLTLLHPLQGDATIYARALPSAIDPFGLFPINPPDGRSVCC
jgi:hypothetical protein